MRSDTASSEIISPCNYLTHHNIDSPEAKYCILNVYVIGYIIWLYIKMHVYHIYLFTKMNRQYSRNAQLIFNYIIINSIDIRFDIDTINSIMRNT